MKRLEKRNIYDNIPLVCINKRFLVASSSFRFKLGYFELKTSMEVPVHLEFLEMLNCNLMGPHRSE